MKIARNVVTAVFAAAVFCCAQTRPPDGNPNSSQPQATADPARGIFVIEPLDMLHIKIEDLSTGMVTVGADGMISLPSIGEVKAAGLTLQQFIDAIKERLKGVVNNPRVGVQILGPKRKPIPGPQTGPTRMSL